MRNLNVLVYPSGTEIAFEIHRSLRRAKSINLIGATSIPNHADFVFKSNLEDAPRADDPSVIDFLNSAVALHSVDYIYPAHDEALLALAQARDRLSAPVLTSPTNTVEICRSKKLTYEHLEGLPFIPSTFANPDEIEKYPVFLKPEIGQGSIGAQKINCRQDLDFALNKATCNYVICEYLDGEEYTVDCFTDKGGNLRVVSPRNRERIRAGIAVRSRTVADGNNEIRGIAEQINERLTFRGAWFFQVKKNRDGELRLLEITPRVPGTMGLTRNLGINLPLMTVFDAEGYDVSVINNDFDLLLDRNFDARYKSGIVYNHVYIDYDDTIISDNLVNEEVMSFLYQSKNQGKHITLISKHAGNLSDSLQSHHIAESLFDEIIHLGQDARKADFINPESAILVDDSFSERCEVRQALGIPVFDVDAIECLIDDRR